jgi:outer membrane receptor protein involved in Fe transport
LAKPLVLNAGLRYDATQFQFGNLSPTDSMLQPRVGLNYMATDTTKLHLFYGKLFQPAPVENLRYKMNPVTGTFSSLDSYDIKAEKNDYYEAGIAQQIFDSQVVQLNAYYKDGTNILDDFQVLNTSIAQPYNFAEGFGYGVELSVKGQLTKDWSEFANYTYTIAKGNGINGGDEESGPGYQMLDHVQVHTSNMGLTYSKNSFWWTTQALYGSGLRTGVFNSRSLPAHLTFDTTVGYQFRGRQWWSQVRLSGDILNILDNRYPITIANGFNGSHYAAGRQAVLRVSKEF